MDQSKPDWCDWWSPGEWQHFVRLLSAVDRENLYATTSGDEDLRALANAVRESPSGRWSSTIKEHVSRRREQVAPARQRVAPDRQQFAEQVLRAMERAGVPHARIDHENFAILHESNGDPQVLNLGPTFIECQHASPEKVSERIAKLVSFATASDGPYDTWDSVRDLLRPVLRAATYGLDVGLTDGMWPLARPALPFLEERVVIDRPTSMQYVMDSDPADWGVSAEDVFAAARANLASGAPQPEPDPADDGPVAVRFVDEDGDHYFTSLPLLDGWLASMASAVGGRPVAFMPDHVSLLVATDTDGIADLLKLVEEEYSEAARSLSPLAYTVDETGAVIPYPAPEGHPVRPAMRRAMALMAATEYGAQKEFLDEYHEAEMIPTFVASLMVTETDYTVTVWGHDVDSLLPRADRVAFVDEHSPPLVVPWEAVAEVVHLTPEAGLDPLRYGVHTWPATDVMRRLRARAVAMP